MEIKHQPFTWALSSVSLVAFKLEIRRNKRRTEMSFVVPISCWLALQKDKKNERDICFEDRPNRGLAWSKPII